MPDFATPSRYANRFSLSFPIGLFAFACCGPPVGVLNLAICGAVGFFASTSGFEVMAAFPVEIGALAVFPGVVNIANNDAARSPVIDLRRSKAVGIEGVAVFGAPY